MKEYIKADRALTPGYLRLIRLGFFVISMISLLFLFKGIAFIQTVMVALLFIILESVSDYVTYAGINSKKQLGMTFLRASDKGCDLLKKALKGDIIGLYFRSFATNMIVSLVCLLSTEGVNKKIAILGTAMITICAPTAVVIVRLLTRRISSLFQVYLPVVLVLSYLAGCAAVVIMLMHFEEAATVYLIYTDVIMIIVGLVFGVLFTVLIVKKGIQGFLGGFTDTEIVSTE